MCLGADSDFYRHILSAAWPLPFPEAETVAIADLPDYLRQNGLRAVGLDWPDGEPPRLRTEPRKGDTEEEHDRK